MSSGVPALLIEFLSFSESKASFSPEAFRIIAVVLIYNVYLFPIKIEIVSKEKKAVCYRQPFFGIKPLIRDLIKKNKTKI
jgi:hypothetical protein